MSHGHDHKDYKRVFGDVERASKGLIVLCDGDAPKTGGSVRQQSRAVCLGKPLEACNSCEHSVFKIRLKPLGNQLVACPQWNTIGERYDKVKPRYEMVRRELCLTVRPYEHCTFCPNKDISNPAEIIPGWWELKKWKED